MNKFKISSCLLLFFVFINFFSVRADTTTIKFIGIKPKAADTIHCIDVISRFLWDAKLFKEGKEVGSFFRCSPDTISTSVLEKADKIIIKTNFTIDSNLLNKTYVLRYSSRNSLSIKINNREIVKINKPFRTNRFVLFKEDEDAEVYFSFYESKVLIEICYSNFDLSSAVGKIEIGDLKWKDDNTRKSQIEKDVNITKLVFFLVIGIVILLQFLFYKQRIENLYFSLFCLFYSISLFGDLFDLSIFVSRLFFAFSAICFDLLATYLSLVLTDKKRTKIPLYVFGSICFMYIILQMFLKYFDLSLIIQISGVLYLIYNGFICVYLLFQGGTKRKWEVKYISYGFLSSLIIIIVFLILINILSKNQDSIFQYLYTIALFVIPTTIAIIIGKRNGMNQLELIKQFEEIKILSEENIKKEKEKQAILAEQNIVLEQKVVERTSELIHQKQLVEEKNEELNQQNEEIISQRDEIEAQRDLVTIQKERIEEIHKEVTDSINYAKRIQQAKLPKLEDIYSCLPQSFILFKPKDIVSGDFYFFHKQKGCVIIAAVDCTGHGVPGAFMSMIGSERLEDAVSQNTETSEILKQLNIGIKTSLRQSESEESTRDGMDIALCSVEFPFPLERDGRVRLKYAGANRPLWIIRKGQTEIEETKATKKAIGGLTEDSQHFESHELILQKGDTFYIFSDGYADQFNADDKKLMTKKLKEILLSIQEKSMKEQKEYLNSFIENWKGNTEQTDDVLVIGVRV